MKKIILPKINPEEVSREIGYFIYKSLIEVNSEEFKALECYDITTLA